MSIELLVEKWRTEYARGAGPMHFANRCADELEACMAHNTPAPQVEMVSELQSALARAVEMLRTAGPIVAIHAPDEIVHYDEADCDGTCIAMDCAHAADHLDMNQAALNARAGGDAKDAERWRYLRAKIGFSGNGDGTSSMFAINLPVRVAGWPEVGQHAEFIDAAIDSEIAALASQAVGVKDGK